MIRLRPWLSVRIPIRLVRKVNKILNFWLVPHTVIDISILHWTFLVWRPYVVVVVVSPPHQYLGTQNNSLAASVVLLLLQTRYSSSLQKYKKIGPDKPIIVLLYPYKALLLYKWLSFLLSWQSHQDQTFFLKNIYIFATVWFLLTCIIEDIQRSSI